MPKPACVKCQCFYRMVRSGRGVIEAMPNGTSDRSENVRGKRKPEAWKPYKLWMADLWRCPDCGHELISGWASQPISEHYKEDFAEAQLRYPPIVTINDC